MEQNIIIDIFQGIPLIFMAAILRVSESHWLHEMDLNKIEGLKSLIITGSGLFQPGRKNRIGICFVLTYTYQGRGPGVVVKAVCLKSLRSQLRSLLCR